MITNDLKIAKVGMQQCKICIVSMHPKSPSHIIKNSYIEPGSDFDDRSNNVSRLTNTSNPNTSSMYSIA